MYPHSLGLPCTAGLTKSQGFKLPVLGLSATDVEKLFCIRVVKLSFLGESFRDTEAGSMME